MTTRPPVTFSWSCAKCVKLGTVAFILRPKESTTEGAKRCASELRQRCIEGCAYRVEQ